MGLPRYNEAGFTHYEWERLSPKMPDGCGYQQKFAYNAPLNATGCNYLTIEWAIENLNYRFGWWFDENRMCHMSFENKNDMAYWMIKNYNKQHRD